MKYMLDTNIYIYIINKKPRHVLNKFKTILPGDVLISSVTLAELSYGVEKSLHQEQNRAALEEFIIPLEVAPFDDAAAHCYGVLRTHLEKKGNRIGPLDLMIASHAQSLEVTLVTNNVKEFLRVPKLKIEDWTKS